MKYNIGDKLRVINAGSGAYGANGKIGYVTSEIHENGLTKRKENAFNIKTEDGSVWRVSNNGTYELIQHNVIKKPNSNVHMYEHLPYILNTIVRNNKGEIIQTQNIKKDTNTYKVIYNSLTTIVILSDGSKGIAKCNPSDTYSLQKGHDIAFNRANIKRLEKQLKNLTK